MQVLSATVAKAIRTTHGSEVEETVKFIENFFECLNVTNYDSGRKERKPFKEPYRSPDDFRLKWLQDFTDYLEQSNKSVKSRVGYSDKQKQSMLLSPETRLGIKITGKCYIFIFVYTCIYKYVFLFLQ